MKIIVCNIIEIGLLIKVIDFSIPTLNFSPPYTSDIETQNEGTEANSDKNDNFDITRTSVCFSTLFYVGFNTCSNNLIEEEDTTVLQTLVY